MPTDQDQGLLRCLWARVQEPKVITLYQFAIYLTVAFTGLAALFYPPMSIEGAIGPVLTRLFAGLLTAGGALGSVAVLLDVDDPDLMDFGAIAEEVADAGLTDLVFYDDEGRVDGIRDHHLPWALLAVVRRQRDQIDALAARLDRLEA